MEQNLNATLLTTPVDPEDVRVIQQEDFEHDLIRLSSLSSALNQAKEKKQNLQRRLESLILVGLAKEDD
ncbi:hypothetical protein RYX36_005088, partial [Vicia faba]